MSAFKLTASGDLDTSTGRLVVLGNDDSTLLDEIAQKLAIRFRFFRGEWSLDQSVGIPYFEQVLVKNPSTATMKALFSETITTTPGIASLNSLELSLDSATRTLSVVFSATTDFGLTLNFDRSFVVPTIGGAVG